MTYRYGIYFPSHNILPFLINYYGINIQYIFVAESFTCGFIYILKDGTLKCEIINQFMHYSLFVYACVWLKKIWDDFSGTRNILKIYSSYKIIIGHVLSCLTKNNPIMSNRAEISASITLPGKDFPQLNVVTAHSSLCRNVSTCELSHEIIPRFWIRTRRLERLRNLPLSTVSHVSCGLPLY